MADNTPITSGAGVTVAAREVTYSGDSAKAPVVGLVTFAGADDAKTVADVPAGGGVEATALRVTVASDSTGVLSVDDNGGSLTVDAASLPLPTGASTSALQGGGLPAALGAGGGLKVDGSGTALPVSAASLPLPTGASTAAKQPALGTAGSPSTDVITVQGIASGTAQPVGGNIAAGAADSGHPVKVGGKHDVTLPTLADGARGDLEVGSRGSLSVQLMAKDGASGVTISTAVDGASTVGQAMRVYSGLYNGASLDLPRSNHEATLLASAARTASVNSADQTNYNGQGVLATINVSVEGAPTVSLKLQGKDPVSGNYFDVVDFGAVYTAASDVPGAKTVSFFPGNVAADHVGIAAGTAAKSGILPRIWRAVVTPSDATSTTYSLASVTV